MARTELCDEFNGVESGVDGEGFRDNEEGGREGSDGELLARAL